jgi:hypothetical protein
MNTWPGGYRHAMYPDEHEAWNATHYPGTRQLCSLCEQPTGRCEEDSIFRGDEGPLCEECASELSDPLETEAGT